RGAGRGGQRGRAALRRHVRARRTAGRGARHEHAGQGDALAAHGRAGHALRRGARRRPRRLVTGSAFLLLALAGVVAAGNWWAVEVGNRPVEYVCKPLTMVLLIAATLALDPTDATARGWFVAALVL